MQNSTKESTSSLCLAIVVLVLMIPFYTTNCGCCVCFLSLEAVTIAYFLGFFLPSTHPFYFIYMTTCAPLDCSLMWHLFISLILAFPS